MELNDLSKAIERVNSDSDETDFRKIAYLATFDHNLALGSSKYLDRRRRYFQIVNAVYGWMPRVLRIDIEFLSDAIEALEKSKSAECTNGVLELVTPISKCLRSVVGATKALHFSNPEIYPIWDSKVAKTISNRQKLPHGYMGEVSNYVGYLNCLLELRNKKEFLNFYDDYSRAYSNRLERFHIPNENSITAMRALESAIFELS